MTKGIEFVSDIGLAPFVGMPSSLCFTITRTRMVIAVPRLFILIVG